MDNDLLEDYLTAHTDKEPELLRQLDRETNAKLLNGRMVSGHYQGRLLVMLCRMLRPKKVLELGTFTGYSAICFAEGTGEEAEIHTVEHNDELEDIISGWFEKSGYAGKIQLHIGEATEWIERLEGPFDLVFLDVDKRDYKTCFDAVLPKVAEGGIILADNTLWYGKFLGPVASNDAQSLAIIEFNDYIAENSGLEKITLPIRDGLTIIRKK